MQVIPAINTISFGEAERQIKQAAEFSNWIHIDVVDGVFAPNVTWGAPEELKLLVASGQPLVANFEIHLMVENPEQVLKSWLEAGLPNEALAKAGINRENAAKEIDAIAVTIGPGLATSLMVGIETAKTLSFAWGVPLVKINHIEGHIYANWIGVNSKFQIPNSKNYSQKGKKW